MGRLLRRLERVFCCCRAESNPYAEPFGPEGPGSPTARVVPTVTSEKIPPKDAADGLTPFQQQARQIARIPVAGMRRTTGPGGVSSYVTMHQTIQNPGRPVTASSSQPSTMHVPTDQSTLSSSSGTTVVGPEGYYCPLDEKNKETIVPPALANSTWQGKPKGTSYDRREELTQEDEDMWAMLAM